ncbi:hypothetical protein FACS1894116_12150 [Betaproteobacteria bacterium]|nr:hypothetical protein FACS1894116_12150 [Betaproteobacteria bacterium]GHU00347.1 hypothetical protein FACS1894154_09250 [Betaproteobacteria bacterium]GHU28281.1 hypothetical protein FACS189497_03340 [Betaproteobacteria bacterium]
MGLNIDAMFDTSLSNKRNLFFVMGLGFLTMAIFDLAQGKSWILSGRLRWLGEALVEFFGGYGAVGFEFVLAIYCIYNGVVYSMKLKKEESKNGL